MDKAPTTITEALAAVAAPAAASPELRERLAAHLYGLWAEWMKRLLEEGAVANSGALTIEPALVEAYQRRVSTLYTELPSGDRGLQLAEADKVLALVQPAVAESISPAANPLIAEHRAALDQLRTARPLSEAHQRYISAAKTAHNVSLRAYLDEQADSHRAARAAHVVCEFLRERAGARALPEHEGWITAHAAAALDR